jgi:hypothetical protein
MGSSSNTHNTHNASISPSDVASIGVLGLSPTESGVDTVLDLTSDIIVEPIVDTVLDLTPDTIVGTAPFDRVPSNWVINVEGEGIRAVNRHTQVNFVGSIADFNLKLRG